MIPAIRSTIDAVLWLTITAAEQGLALQPLKLHRLMYLAQCHYAAQSKGQKLMPATFLATKYGPIEPTIYHLLEAGPPPVTGRRPKREIEDFLEVLLRKYGHHSPEYLEREIRRDGAFVTVLDAYPNGEIPVSLMAKAYSQNPQVRRIEVPKLSQDGRKVSSWRPKQVTPESAEIVARPARKPEGKASVRTGPRPAPGR
ncbi:MAG: hypothetical protein FJX47_05970 [Alphaproteobacteria bacterium]|nr:hypothetical protein [Alphaproteobacteria bacterium]